MKGTRLIVFDLDGTLVDSFAGIRTGLNLALSDLGLPHRDLAWVRRHVGRGASRLIATAAGNDGNHDALMTAFRHHYGEVLTDTTPPYPGVDGALIALASDHTLAIILEQTGRSTDESLLVGDMPVDAETGGNAGIPVIGVATGSCPAEDLRAAGCVDVISGVPALPHWLATMPGTQFQPLARNNARHPVSELIIGATHTRAPRST